MKKNRFNVKKSKLANMCNVLRVTIGDHPRGDTLDKTYVRTRLGVSVQCQYISFIRKGLGKATLNFIPNKA